MNTGDKARIDQEITFHTGDSSFLLTEKPWGISFGAVQIVGRDSFSGLGIIESLRFWVNSLYSY
jgi:hypothetical protein